MFSRFENLQISYLARKVSAQSYRLHRLYMCSEKMEERKEARAKGDLGVLSAISSRRDVFSHSDIVPKCKKDKYSLWRND